MQSTAAPATYISGSGPASAYAITNAERLKCGFGALNQASALDVSAQKHAAYLKQAFLDRLPSYHTEDPARPLFYAATGPERATKAGYLGTSPGENIAVTSLYPSWPVAKDAASRAEVSVRQLLTSIYHLSGMMGGYRDVGIAIEEITNQDGSISPILVWQPGTPTGKESQYQLKTVLSYPCDGSAGVRPAFLGEIPDPFVSIVPNAAGNVGAPIFISAPDATTLSVDSAVLATADGQPVTTFVYAKKDDPNGLLTTNEAFVVPRQPLLPKTTYKLTYTASTSFGVVTKSLQFTTGEAGPY